MQKKILDLRPRLSLDLPCHVVKFHFKKYTVLYNFHGLLILVSRGVAGDEFRTHICHWFEKQRNTNIDIGVCGDVVEQCPVLAQA